MPVHCIFTILFKLKLSKVGHFGSYLINISNLFICNSVILVYSWLITVNCNYGEKLAAIPHDKIFHPDRAMGPLWQIFNDKTETTSRPYLFLQKCKILPF